jgi:flagellar biosynthesis GTPase FlhF
MSSRDKGDTKEPKKKSSSRDKDKEPTSPRSKSRSDKDEGRESKKSSRSDKGSDKGETKSSKSSTSSKSKKEKKELPTNNLRELVKARLLAMFDELPGEDDNMWKVLIVDKYTLSVISSACRVRDILQKNITSKFEIIFNLPFSCRVSSQIASTIPSNGRSVLYFTRRRKCRSIFERF